ncbi:hypothetical protein Tco_1377554 [Tanacetum coccineum]
MAYFQSLHSHLQVLLKDDLKGTRIEHGFKRAFMSLFGQDVDTFTSTMLLNFQKFIDLKFTLDYDSQMTDKYFVEYTGIEVKHFRDTLLQHMGNVKKSIAERTHHQRQNGTESEVQNDNSRSGNDIDVDDANIRPIYDEEQMAEYPEQCQVISPILDSSLESENILLKKIVAQFQKDFSRMEAHCIALELKYQNQSLKLGQHGQILNETRNKAKIKKEIDALETMNIELEHSVAKLRKLFDCCTSKVDSEPPHGSNVDIPNIHECKQTLDVSAGTSINVQKEQSLDLSAVGKSVRSFVRRIFQWRKSSCFKVFCCSYITADANEITQQLPDQLHQHQTLATTVTADENFNL